MKVVFLFFLLLFSISSFSQWTSNTSVNTEIAPLNTGSLQTATTSDGKTWIAFYHNVGGAYQMRAQLLDVDGTQLLGSNGVLVSSEPSCVLTTGEIIVAWNNNSPATMYLQKLTSAGVPVWGSPVVVQVGVTNTTAGQPIAISEGGFILIIQRKSSGVSSTLFAQRYTNAGTPVWASPVQLSNITTATVRYYSLLTNADTAYLGYYAASGSRFFSYLQRINPDGGLPYGINGAVFSTYSTGSDPYMMTTNIEKDPGSPVIWSVCSFCNTAQSQYGVYVQKFNIATGAKQLDPLGKVIYPISANREQHIGTISIINGGPVFMHYEDVNYRIYATRLDDLGNFVWPGNKVELSSTTATLGTPKGRFAFTKMTGNQSVAVWYENRLGEYHPYAQNITAGGATGPGVIVPVTLTDLKGNRNGKIIVLTWTTMTENNNSGDTYTGSVLHWQNPL